MRIRSPVRAMCVVCFLVLTAASAFAQNDSSYVRVSPKSIPAGSKVFVGPMPGGFETYLVAGLMKKKVPLTVVNDIRRADYEISGVSQSDKAGWAKMLFMGSDRTREQASIKVINLKSGEVVFGYSVHKGDSVRGKQSAAEACAKHLKEVIEQ